MPAMTPLHSSSSRPSIGSSSVSLPDTSSMEALHDFMHHAVRRDRLQAHALAASERRNRLAATIAEREALLREMERELAEEEETVSAAVAELSMEEDVVSQLGREASGWPLFTAAVQHFRNGGRRDAAFVSFVETALLAVGVPVDWATFGLNDDDDATEWPAIPWLPRNDEDEEPPAPVTGKGKERAA